MSKLREVTQRIPVVYSHHRIMHCLASPEFGVHDLLRTNGHKQELQMIQTLKCLSRRCPRADGGPTWVGSE